MNPSDGPPTPEMCEGLLDTAQVMQLFSDLADCTQIVAILEKGGAQDYATSSVWDLAATRDRVLKGEVGAVQIRYLYDDSEWIDTLLLGPTGIRVVRCKQ